VADYLGLLCALVSDSVYLHLFFLVPLFPFPTSLTQQSSLFNNGLLRLEERPTSIRTRRPRQEEEKGRKGSLSSSSYLVFNFLLIQIRFALMGFKQNLCFFNPIFLNPNV
jgi:hypothetical protein